MRHKSQKPLLTKNERLFKVRGVAVVHWLDREQYCGSYYNVNNKHKQRKNVERIEEKSSFFGKIK